jgi:hypothetical protein
MTKFHMGLLLLLSITGARALGDPPTSCWVSLHDISPRLSADSDCVLQNAKTEFLALCEDDGIAPVGSFRAYIALRAQYLDAKREAAEWLKANPGASKFPPAVAAKIKNAETAWVVAGKRNDIDDKIEKLRRQSKGCN